jgi:hypothetical protein
MICQNIRIYNTFVPCAPFWWLLGLKHFILHAKQTMKSKGEKITAVPKQNFQAKKFSVL